MTVIVWTREVWYIIVECKYVCVVCYANNVIYHRLAIAEWHKSCSIFFFRLVICLQTAISNGQTTHVLMFLLQIYLWFMVCSASNGHLSWRVSTHTWIFEYRWCTLPARYGAGRPVNGASSARAMIIRLHCIVAVVLLLLLLCIVFGGPRPNYTLSVVRPYPLFR